MCVRATLAVLLLFVAASAATPDVTFWRKEFTLICTDDGVFHKSNNITNTKAKTYTAEYNNTMKGLYYCEYDDDTGTKKYDYFYVQGKACENCFELDGSLFALAIILDMIGTAALMGIICRCTKKKSSAGPSFTPKAPARPGGRGPPVPSPDYEQLNVNTRSQDTYSMVNRTG